MGLVDPCQLNYINRQLFNEQTGKTDNYIKVCEKLGLSIGLFISVHWKVAYLVIL